MDNAMIAKTLKYLKDCWYSEYYTDDEYSDEQYDEISEVVDYVISDILKIKLNEEPTDFKVGDIVRAINTRPKLDVYDVGVITNVEGRLIYVMRDDGTFTIEEAITWYKVGHVTWFDLCMTDIKNVLEEY